MAVCLYKDGEMVLVEPSRLQAHLDAGYSLTKEPVKEEKDPETPMGDYERELRDKIKSLGGKVGGRASIETIEKKLAELEAKEA